MMMKLKFIFLLSYCYVISSHQMTSSTFKKGIFQGNINVDPRCVIVSMFANMLNSPLVKHSLCKVLCAQNGNCIGYLFNVTTCTLLTYMVLPPLATDVGTEYYALQGPAYSSTEVDIARYKQVTATNQFFQPPTTYVTYSSPSLVTGGVVCNKVMTDCWCGTSSIMIDLVTTTLVSKIVITPHPWQLAILGINITKIFVGNAPNPGPTQPEFAVIRSIPTAGQKMSFTGSMSGRYIFLQKFDPANPNVCSCFIQAFS